MTNSVAKNSTFPISSSRNISFVFTTRADGNLALHIGDDPTRVERARIQLAERCGFRSDQLRWMDQVHGDCVIVVDTATVADQPCDALVTTDSGIALAVMVADCIPVLFASEQVLGVAHVGRKGLMNEVALHTIERMQALGDGPIEAIFGPSICGRCYEVPEPMYQQVCSRWPAASARTPTGSYGLDLPAALEQQLSGRVSIIRDARCTHESAELFSYRRDGQAGRTAGLIWRSA